MASKTGTSPNILSVSNSILFCTSVAHRKVLRNGQSCYAEPYSL